MPESVNLISYTFTDEPNAANIYYRIKVKGRKADVTYLSKTIEASHKAVVYPTIFTNEINIQVTNLGDNNYSVENTQGQVIKLGRLAAIDNKILLSDLPIGIYLLKIKSGKSSTIHKIIKQNE